MDAGPLFNLGRGHYKFSEQAKAYGLPREDDPLTILAPLTKPGQCTLVIPRYVVQEVLTTPKNKNDGTQSAREEYGVVQGSGSPFDAHAAYIAANAAVPSTKRGIYDLLRTAQNRTVKDVPQLRYYASPQAFINAEEATKRRGGIVIVDTPETLERSPLSSNGRYATTAMTQRGDEQIRSFMQAMESAYGHNATYPIISEDRAFLKAHVPHQRDITAPFAMNLRALIHFEEGLQLFDPSRTLTHFSHTNPPESAMKTPGALSKFRRRSIAAAREWFDGLSPQPSVTEAQPGERVRAIGASYAPAVGIR